MKKIDEVNARLNLLNMLLDHDPDEVVVEIDKHTLIDLIMDLQDLRFRMERLEIQE